MEELMIDLLKPNVDDLMKKWGYLIALTAGIKTWTTDPELAWIAEYASRCTNYLEIGSHSGRSAKIALMANQTLKLTSLDTWDDEGSFEAYQRSLEAEIAEGRVQWIRGPSQKSLEQIEVNGQFWDGCFIDGGHEEHLVAADIKGVLPRLQPGSLTAGHDVGPAEKNDVWRGVTGTIWPVENPVESIWTHQL